MVYCKGLNNYQHHVEVYLRYPFPYPYEESTAAAFVVAQVSAVHVRYHVLLVVQEGPDISVLPYLLAVRTEGGEEIPIVAPIKP